MKSFTVNKNDSGQRLDKFLSKSVPLLPQPLLYQYVRTKKIKVNGKRAEANYRLLENDVVDLYIKDEFFSAPQNSFSAILPRLTIVYEDENILLVDKKPGMIVHSDDKETVNTLIDHIKAYLYRAGTYLPENENSFAPALCNRIDRNTGGIVICAKNAAALRAVNEMIKNQEVAKYYLALLHGIPAQKNGVLRHYLHKRSDENLVVVSDTPGRGALTAITEYHVLKESREKNISLIRARLVTGRTHQIRAQFAHIGLPLVGDGKYGRNAADKKRGYPFQALYSYRLIFHPAQKDNLLFYLKDQEFTVGTVYFEREL